MGRQILENEQLMLQVDMETGVLTSLKLKQDMLQTEYLGNSENISYPEIRKKNQWMGDLRFRIWDDKKHEWLEETTSASKDVCEIRTVETRKQVDVFYRKPSAEYNGIKHILAEESYCMLEDGLHWYIKVENPSQMEVEIGEISLAFLTNTDFTGIFENPEYASDERWSGTKQKLWHEQRVQQHLCINGSSSYVLLQRPKGDYPALLFQVLDGDRLEEAYQIDKHIGCQWSVTFEGPYYLSIYSNGARKAEGWKFETEQQRYGINGNTSLLLGAGEKRSFHFAFHPVFSEEGRKDLLYRAGQLDIDIQPSMVVPLSVPVQIRIRSRYIPELIPASNHIIIEKVRNEKEYYFYQLKFGDPGQKKIIVRHGRGTSVLLFYSLYPVRTLLKNHVDFIVKRQYYDNEMDPFGRCHAFLPYDDSVETLYTESEESWQVGGLDEYALPVAMFTAEMNSIWPDPEQIAVLEEYVDKCLYGKLQEKITFYARRGLYYEEKMPSDIFYGNKWDKETSESILRSFNYPLICNIYFAMFKIADKYALTRVRSAGEYLEMAYKTALTGYELGRNRFNGAPAGATVIELLKILQNREPEWYEKLNQKISYIAEVNAESEYPFGSELYVDQTAHNQYEAMMRYYHKDSKLEEVYRVTEALRGGWQPEWFQYGNEKRGNVCCWYGTPLNSRVLFEGYEYTGDEKLLKLGMGGLYSFLTCIRGNGAAHGWYLCWPDRSGFDLRSLDTDMGMYGYLFSAKAYVVEDSIFGRCGYGCLYEKDGEAEILTPYDGLGIRIYHVPGAFEVSCSKGCISRMIVYEKKKKVAIQMEELYNDVYDMEIQAKTDWTVLLNGRAMFIKAGKNRIRL